MEAIPRFLNDSMALWGHVPVTQLQIEIHVANRLQSYAEERKLVRSYAKFGLLRGRNFSAGWNNPQRVMDDVRARRMLDSLRDHGFVPFHIHLNDASAEGPMCCGTEYSLLNSRAPTALLPATSVSASQSRAGGLMRGSTGGASRRTRGVASVSDVAPAWHPMG